MTPETTDAFRADVRAMLRRRAARIPDRSEPALPTGRVPVVVRNHQDHGRRVPVAAAGLALLLLVALGGVAASTIGSGGGDHPQREEVVVADRDPSTSSTDRAGTTSDEGGGDRATEGATAGRRRAGGRATSGGGTRSSGGPRRPTGDPDRPGAGPGPGSGSGPGSAPGSGSGPGSGPGAGPGTTTPPPPVGPGAPAAAVVVDGLEEHRWLQRHCDGSLSPTRFDLLVRLDRSGSTSRPLTVRLGVSGPLVAPAPGTFTFPAGSSHGIVTLALPAQGAVEVVVDVLPGDGYAPGSPSRWRFSDPDPPVRIDCLRPLEVTSGSTSQTIQVGEVPGEVVFGHELPDLVSIVLDGAAPPGLALVPVAGPVLRWEGEATTPGTYSFDVHTCHGDECDGTAHITITVLSRAVEGDARSSWDRALGPW
jgi:hypothetical protein